MALSISLECPSCGSKGADDEASFRCPKCGEILEHSLSDEYLKSVKLEGALTFWKYSPVMPRVERPVSLREGGTPLRKAERLGENLGMDNLLLKDETRNPTSSFKDRSASLIASDAIGKGFDSMVCATNGNMGLLSQPTRRKKGWPAISSSPPTWTSVSSLR